MKITELRMGNFLESKEENYLFRKGIISVSLSTLSKLNVYGCDILHEIPLTIVFLTENGFIKIGGGYSEKTDLSHEYYSKNEVHVRVCENGKITYQYPNFEIKYVHQMQNIYFSLTGKELVHIIEI